MDHTLLSEEISQKRTRVLVTGGAGFIGSHLIKRLLQEGYEVSCVDNLNDYYDVELKRARLAQILQDIRFFEVDITDESSLRSVFEEVQPQIICHLAAQAGVRYSLTHPEVYLSTNIVGSHNIFQLAREFGVEHVLIASTSSVYGTTETLPFREDQSADTPRSIYAMTKRAVELMAHTFADQYAQTITAFRFFTVYGEWGRPDMALFLFTDKILKGEPIQVFNGGDMKRDFTYVEDIVEGFMKGIITRPNGYQIYNLGCGQPIALMHYIELVEAALGQTAIKEFLPMQAGDMQSSHADISKARRELGYEPRVSVEEGIPRFVEWYRSYHTL